MKLRTEGMRRAMTGLRSAVPAAAVLAAVAAAPGAAAEAGEAGLGPEGPRLESPRLESLRVESLRPEGLVSALRANGAEVVPLGARGGLKGYFVTPVRGGGYGLYVTGDGHAVAGLLYGPDGTEITGAQLAAARAGEGSADERGAGPPRTGGTPVVSAHAEIESSAPPSSSSTAAALFERSAAAFGFTLGERGPVVVLLGDAACPWSRSAAARLGREALAGRLQLRVVPVAVLGAAAARRAVAIAAHPDPARAWFEGGAADTRAGDTRAGDTRAGETRAGDPRPGDRTGAQRIARNNALLDGWRANAVPLIAWRAPDGAVGHRIGDVDDVDAWLKETLVPDTLGVGGGP